MNILNRKKRKEKKESGCNPKLCLFDLIYAQKAKKSESIFILEPNIIKEYIVKTKIWLSKLLHY